jgi:hypothetical protein
MKIIKSLENEKKAKDKELEKAYEEWANDKDEQEEIETDGWED